MGLPSPYGRFDHRRGQGKSSPYKFGCGSAALCLCGEFFLGCSSAALCEAGNADYLVTGDKCGLLALDRHKATRIRSKRPLIRFVPQHLLPWEKVGN